MWRFILFAPVLSLSLLSLLVSRVLAGQGLTQGLSIINAPSPGSPGHAGSKLPISVEVSGNGNLPEDSAIELLEIFLVSSETNINFTVAQGDDFLANESGSVRHLDWPIPACVPPGQYNLTFYETSRISGDEYFVITSVPLPVQNPNKSGDCTEGVNDLQQQPQPFNPSPANPSSSAVTITMSASDRLPLDSTYATTKTVAESAIVVIIESENTITTTLTAASGLMTSTITQTSLSTTSMDAASIPGFVAANGGIKMGVTSLHLNLLFGLLFMGSIIL